MNNRLMSFISITIAAGTGFLVGKYRKDIGNFVKGINKFHKTGEHGCSNKSDTELQAGDDNFEQRGINESVVKEAKNANAINNEPTFSIEKAREQFANTVSKYYGCFEYLYKSSNGEVIAPDLSDWDARILSNNGCADLISYWKESKQNLTQFIEFIFSCGVQRDLEKKIVADNNTRYKYHRLDGGDIIEGEAYDIVSPYWFYGTETLEKGLIK